MTTLLLRRFGRAIGVLFLVSVLTFLALRLTPGDPALLLMGPQAGRADNYERYLKVREEMGLDESLPVQYGIWIGSVLRGDLGESNRSGQPVTEAVVEKLPATLALAAAGLIFAIPTSIVIGVIAARRRSGAVDRVMRTTTTLFLAVPGFWVGILMILAFSVALGWLPPSGYRPLSAGPGTFLRHLIMPSIALGLVLVGILTRFVYTEMCEILESDYVRNLRALGVSESEILFRHAARNALLPMISVVGLQTGTLIGGAVLIEQVFGFPGVGQLMLQGVLFRDYQIVQGAVIIVTVGILAANYLVDVLYRGADPRIRVG